VVTATRGQIAANRGGAGDLKVATTGVLDFVLPKELEARVPPEARGLRRDEVRLMVSHRVDDSVQHAQFADLPHFLATGDLLVVNDSATLPAAITARRADGAEIALHFSTKLRPGVWVVEPRRTSVDAGESVSLPAGGRVTFLQRHHGSPRLWVACVELPGDAVAYLHKYGRPITYDYVDGEWPIEMYQTIFARKPGSSEMPSAARPFSADVVAALERKGVRIAAITLHTGVASLEKDEPPYEEWCEVPPETAAAIRITRSSGGRVIAVGTTVVRTLESALDGAGVVRPSSGWTDLVITAERGARAVDGLLTGFHEPRATHLAMLEAIASPAHVKAAYAAALGGGYLWHEFGDVHLIID
jgi:S-adenosylmethionine:tRNA ribosyltransferase-isomerase